VEEPALCAVFGRGRFPWAWRIEVLKQVRAIEKPRGQRRVSTKKRGHQVGAVKNHEVREEGFLAQTTEKNGRETSWSVLTSGGRKW